MGMMKLLATPALLALSAVALFADRLDDEANRVRALKGTTIIKCSPYGKVEGTVSYEEAVKKAKRGCVIQFLPGFYNPIELLIFDDDGIIIEGDGSGGLVNLPIVCYGRDVIVRNIVARSIEVDDANIVDAMACHIIVTSGGVKNAKTLLYNCCMNGISLYPNLQDISLKDCTIVNAVERSDSGEAIQQFAYGLGRQGYYSVINIGEIPKKGKLTIENCIINSNADLFSRPEKELELTLKDNLIFLGHSIIPVPKDKPPIKFDAIEAQFAPKGTVVKGNLSMKPVFLNPAVGWIEGWNLNPKTFTLSPQSPGADKGWGVNMGEKGVPVPEQKK
jgi:hypothetical protein